MPVSDGSTPSSNPPWRRLFAGRALSVVDYRCSAGPGDAPFAEHHRSHSIAYVRRGAFGCRCRGRSFELVPGSLFIGHPGDEYVCTHDGHGAGGDECLSFQFEPEAIDELGGAPAAWRVGALPPLPQTTVLGALAQASAEGHSDLAVEEVGWRLACHLIERLGAGVAAPPAVTAAARRRAVRAALWIDEHATEDVDLDRAAAEAACSRFHFLRLFARVFGLTPHQYLIRRRLARAARMLAEEPSPVTEVAMRSGFGDLSNFVRTFGRAAGCSPQAFRRSVRGGRRGREQGARLRNFLQDPVAAVARG